MVSEFATCYAAITVYCMVFAILVALKTSSDIGSEREVLYFRGIVFPLIIFCFTDAIWALGNFGVIYMPEAILYLLSIVSTEALAFSCYFWYCFGETRLGSKLVDRSWKRAIAAIPLVVLALLYTTTYWTHWMFYYTDDVAYRMHQGPFYAGSIGFMGLYIAVVSIHSAIRASHEQSRALRREYLSYVAFAVPPIVAGIFDTFVSDMPVIAPSLFMSVFFVFLTLQESQIYNDALTGLNNRRRADDYLTTSIANASESSPVALFMIDVNKFKQINDIEGHVEGDHALQAVANAIRKTCTDTKSFAARWGGDEFMVIAEDGAVAEPETFVAQLHHALADEKKRQNIEYNLDISAGWTQCSDPQTRAGRLIAAADEMLYRNKRHTYTDAYAASPV